MRDRRGAAIGVRDSELDYRRRMKRDPSKLAMRCRREAEQACSTEVAQNFRQIAEDLEKLVRELDQSRSLESEESSERTGTRGGKHGGRRVSGR
jgi:hypothetical protein